MIYQTYVFALVHRIPHWILLNVLTLGVGVAVGDSYVSLAIISSGPPRPLPGVELLGLFNGVLVHGILCSGLWTWEVSARRAGVALATGLIATMSILGVASLPLVFYGLRGGSYDPVGVISDVILITSIAIIAGCFLGSWLGSILALVVYFTMVVLQEQFPDMAGIAPITRLPGDERGNIYVALAIGIIAVATWTKTLGKSGYAARAQP